IDPYPKHISTLNKIIKLSDDTAKRCIEVNKKFNNSNIIDIFCDGAYQPNSDTNHLGVGIVLQDQNNKTENISIQLATNGSSDLAELLAIAIAINLIKHNTVTYIHTDSAVAINEITNARKNSTKKRRYLRITDYIHNTV
ncbi:15331_t:CDS:1, partial [Acaulospora colombiana]